MLCRSCGEQSCNYLCDDCTPSLARRGAYIVLSLHDRSLFLTEFQAIETLRDRGLSHDEAMDYLSETLGEDDDENKPRIGCRRAKQRPQRDKQ